jgi:hypothetical protein
VISVETVLKMCGLEKYADAIVGTLGVEHKKRTTIGVELAAKVCKTAFHPALSALINIIFRKLSMGPRI